MENTGMSLTESPLPGAEGTKPVRNDALLKLAHSTIGLSLVAPRLSELASSRQTEAQRQAEHVRNITNLVREMTTTLEQTMQQLRLSTSEIGQLTSLIKRIADETRMISINAGIVAAHAGEQGRAFSVLAKEIRSLSENTAEATKDVQGKIERLEENTLRTVQTMGLQEDSGLNGNNGHGLTWLLDRMEEADASAIKQAGEARELNELGSSLRELSEEMIQSVGSFRLDVHDRIEHVVEELRVDREIISADPRWQITALRQVVRNYPFIELAYITDVQGIQTLENVTRNDFRAAYGDSGKFKNWSQRSWFIGAMRTTGIHLSEIYRSQATDEFCLTASATYEDQYGNIAGVVAIDVNFREILGDYGYKN